MRMLTGDDAVQIVGEDCGRVFEFPGHFVYPQPTVVIIQEDDTELWSEDDPYENLTPAGWAALDDENERLMASMRG
jgi:hypothetical protein